MMDVSILVPGSAVLAAVDDPRHVFSAVNDFLAADGKPPFFDIKFVGVKRNVKLHNSFTVHTDALLGDVSKTDLILIPAFYGVTEDVLTANRHFIPWIEKQYENGAEVVSLCVGAFFLAKTGLLTGKKNVRRIGGRWTNSARCFRKSIL